MKFRIPKNELVLVSVVWVSLGLIGFLLTISFLPDAIKYLFHPELTSERFEEITGDSFFDYKVQVFLIALGGVLLLFGFFYYVYFIIDYLKHTRKKEN